MVQSVTGEIPAENLGVTLAHEHLFIDMRGCVDKPDNCKPKFFSRFIPRFRYLVNDNPYAVLDNALMDEYSIAKSELEYYKRCGGKSIVDCTLDEIGRDPLKLKKLSEQTGINIVMGCGHYYEKTHFGYVKDASISELAEEMINDLNVGVKNTGIKAGVIGEIGTSAVMSEGEIKVLKAAGIAGKETGKAIHVHTDLYTENGYEIIDILTSKGVKPNKICIDHVDVCIRPVYISNLLKLGVFLEFDNFGKEFFVNKRHRFAYDLDRIKCIVDFIEKGYAGQLLITNDICLKSMLCFYGGNGYSHIIKTVKKMFLEYGLDEISFERIITENVKNFLD